MTRNSQETPAPPQAEVLPSGHQPLGCLARVFWVMLGNAILALCALVIIQERPDALSAADAVYWVTVVLLLAVRYADVAYLSGRTAHGEPATLAHWTRYAMVLLGGAAGLWIAAHVIAGLLGGED